MKYSLDQREMSTQGIENDGVNGTRTTISEDVAPGMRRVLDLAKQVVTKEWIKQKRE